MKLLIVGGVAGGAGAAARARRLSENAEVIIFERGEYVSFANCGLPYYVGGIIDKRDALLIQSPEGLRRRFNIDVRVKNQVKSINMKEKFVVVNDLATGKEYQETYDFLILSPGAEPIVPQFEGSDLACVHTVRTVPDVDRIKEKLDAGSVKKAVVIGAGFIGIEMAENLRERGIETSIVEKLDQIMPPFDKEMAVILERELVSRDIRLFLNEEVVKITKSSNGCVLHTVSGKKLDADIVIMAIGVRPEVDLAKEAGLELGKRGIRVDAQMRTSDSSIFAVGDAVETGDPATGKNRPVPLAGPAAKQALVAVNTIFGIEDAYKGTIGTSIVKVFDRTGAVTGVNEKSLQSEGLSYAKVYTHPADHVGYYPGATMMSVKLLYNPQDGVVLGAQVIGKNDVARKMDVLATAVKQRMTINDLGELELCYAPPYGTSKDAVNLAGMAALNNVRGITELVHWEDVSGKDFLLDVRTQREYNSGNVPNSVNIPVDALRERINEIPKDKRIVVFCQVGIRAHIACRILSQHGFSVVNISGGYLTFLNYRDAYKSPIILSSQKKLDDELFCTSPTGELPLSKREKV